jgi:hypothetical protein
LKRETVGSADQISEETDLKAFKAHGGKLIICQSWGEKWVPPRTITAY